MLNDNVMGEINLLMLNVPKNATPIEKVRWVYIKLGEVFSYDYDYLDRPEGYVGIDYERDYVSRYSSCIEISEIFNLIVNNIDPNIKSEIVARKNSMIRGIGEKDHVCNIVSLSTGEKYVMDLTLDLYLIQSNCKTREFGFTTLNGDEDIISLYECKEMDENLGLIKNGYYRDDAIDEISYEVMNKNYNSFDEMIEEQIGLINQLMVPFRGYQEGKNYLNKLFSKILKCNRKEFNLKYNDGRMITCFLLTDGDNEKWYLYDPTLKLIETNKETIDKMMKSGWNTKSHSLETILESERKR